MNNNIKNVHFLTSKQVSKYLYIPLRTVQKLSKEGKIRAVKIGNQWRYKKADIEYYISKGTNFSREPERIYGEFIERRAYSRINSDFICRYSVNHEPIRKAEGAGEVKNISAGGVFVIGQDDKVENIYIDDGERINIHTKGRVVRKTDNGMGIKFRRISKNYQDEIARYVG